MFVYHEVSEVFWFNPIVDIDDMYILQQYHLVGVVSER